MTPPTDDERGDEEVSDNYYANDDSSSSSSSSSSGSGSGSGNGNINSNMTPSLSAVQFLTRPGVGDSRYNVSPPFFVFPFSTKIRGD